MSGDVVLTTGRVNLESLVCHGCYWEASLDDSDDDRRGREQENK